jgi:hypothetical protein
LVGVVLASALSCAPHLAHPAPSRGDADRGPHLGDEGGSADPARAPLATDDPDVARSSGMITGVAGAGAGPAPGPRARLELTLGEVRGGLTWAQVRSVVGRRQNAFRYCYERELNKDPKLVGRLQLLLTIGADGAVTTANGERGMNADVIRCVEHQALRMRFPEPADAREVHAAMELVFRLDE